jgi:hypothetical protein
MRWLAPLVALALAASVVTAPPPAVAADMEISDDPSAVPPESDMEISDDQPVATPPADDELSDDPRADFERDDVDRSEGWRQELDR